MKNSGRDAFHNSTEVSNEQIGADHCRCSYRPHTSGRGHYHGAIGEQTASAPAILRVKRDGADGPLCIPKRGGEYSYRIFVRAANSP